MPYYDAEGNKISFLAATKFQAKHPREYAAAQKQYGRGGLTVREYMKESVAEAKADYAEKRGEIDASLPGVTPREDAGTGSLGWWQQPDGLRSLGFMKALTLSNVAYFGGWSEHPDPIGKGTLSLTVDGNGFTARKLKAVFTIPWAVVADIAVEGPEEASQRFTATRLALMGPFGLAFKKDRKGSKVALVTETTIDGDEAIFQIDGKIPREIQPKLMPLAIAARNAHRPDLGQSPAEGGLGDGQDPAAQLEKLADLHAKGIVTDEEFAVKKAELLGRM
jgi:hypothetical protein